jgi:hypothetical protein
MPKIFFPSDLINRFHRVTILYLGGEGWAGGGQGEGVASLEDDGEPVAGDGTPACCFHKTYNLQGDFRIFYVCTLFNTATSAAPQIPLCLRMLDRTQDSCDFGIGCQTL